MNKSEKQEGSGFFRGKWKDRKQDETAIVLSPEEKALARLYVAADYEQQASMLATRADVVHVLQTGFLSYECCEEITRIVDLDEKLSAAFPRWQRSFDEVTDDTIQAMRGILKQHSERYRQ